MTDSMTVTLWSSARLLGHAQLSEVTGLPTRTPVMNGPFVPSAGFADVWPVLEAWHRCGAEFLAGAQRVAPGVAPEVFREQMLANVSSNALPAWQEAERAVLALGLELRDEAGRAVPDVSVQVNRWNLLSSVDDSQKALIEAEAARQGISMSGYLMIVTHACSQFQS
jgi:hypothetical protein